MDFSFLIALAFYFIMLGLITYWFAYKTVAVIRTWQKFREGRSPTPAARKMVLGSPAVPSASDG